MSGPGHNDACTAPLFELPFVTQTGRMESSWTAPPTEAVALELGNLRRRGLARIDEHPAVGAGEIERLAQKWYDDEQAAASRRALITRFIGDMAALFEASNDADDTTFISPTFFDKHGKVGRSPTRLKQDVMATHRLMSDDSWDKVRSKRFFEFAAFVVNTVEARVAATAQPGFVESLALEPVESPAVEPVESLAAEPAVGPVHLVDTPPRFRIGRIVAAAVLAVLVCVTLVLLAVHGSSGTPTNQSSGTTTAQLSPPSASGSPAVSPSAAGTGSAAVVTVPALSSTASSKPAPSVSVLPTSRSVVAPPAYRPAFQFDALGGTGSRTIQVYAGPGTSAADHQVTGTFRDGQVMPVVCRAEGRKIVSDPTAGETARTSTTWILVAGTPGATQYATLTYGDLPAGALAKVPTCPI